MMLMTNDKHRLSASPCGFMDTKTTSQHVQGGKPQRTKLLFFQHKRGSLLIGAFNNHDNSSLKSDCPWLKGQ